MVLWMSTILRVEGYRFYWYSNEDNEPIHIHVRRENMKAKFWLSPIRLAGNWGFPKHELNKIAEILENHQTEIANEWSKQK